MKPRFRKFSVIIIVVVLTLMMLQVPMTPFAPKTIPPVITSVEATSTCPSSVAIPSNVLAPPSVSQGLAYNVTNTVGGAATATVYQRHVIYSASTNTFFDFAALDATSYIQVSNSSDGVTWKNVTTITDGSGPASGRFSIFFSTATDPYVHLVDLSSSLRNVYYRRITLTTSGVTVGSEQTITSSGAGGPTYDKPTIAVNIDGYPFVAVYNATTGNQSPYVWKDSANDGTWSTAASFPYQLNATAKSGGWSTNMVPLASDKMLVFYVASTTGFALAKLYDGANWGSAQTVTSYQVQSGSGTNSFPVFSASADSNGNVYVAYLRSNYAIQVVEQTAGATTWSSPVTLQSNVEQASGDNVAPSLSIGPFNEVYVFWAGGGTGTSLNTIYYKRIVSFPTIYDSSPVSWLTETLNIQNYTLSAFRTSFGGYIGLVYQRPASGSDTGANNYQIRFAKLTIATTGMTITVNALTNDGVGVPTGAQTGIAQIKNATGTFNQTLNGSGITVFSGQSASSPATVTVRGFWENSKVYGNSTTTVTLGGSVTVYEQWLIYCFLVPGFTFRDYGGSVLTRTGQPASWKITGPNSTALTGPFSNIYYLQNSSAWVMSNVVYEGTDVTPVGPNTFDSSLGSPAFNLKVTHTFTIAFKNSSGASLYVSPSQYRLSTNANATAMTLTALSLGQVQFGTFYDNVTTWEGSNAACLPSLQTAGDCDTSSPSTTLASANPTWTINLAVYDVHLQHVATVGGTALTGTVPLTAPNGTLIAGETLDANGWENYTQVQAGSIAMPISFADSSGVIWNNPSPSAVTISSATITSIQWEPRETVIGSQPTYSATYVPTTTNLHTQASQSSATLQPIQLTGSFWNLSQLPSWLPIFLVGALLVIVTIVIFMPRKRRGGYGWHEPENNTE